MSTEAIPVVRVDADLCTGCKICLPLCPFGAIHRDEEARVAWIDAQACEGCGACVGACPSAALKQDAFSDAAIYAEIEGFLAAR